MTELSRDPLKNFYGKERFNALIRKNCHKTAEEIVEACFKSVKEFRGDLPVHDDITLIVIKTGKASYKKN